jgi:fucose permease
MQATPAINHAEPKNNRLLVIILCYLVFILLGLPDGMLGVAWPSMRATFGQPLDAMGVLLISSTCGFLAVSVIVGRLMGRFGIATFLVIASLTRMASMLGYAVAPAWWLMALSAFAYGMGSGAIDAGLNTFFAMSFSPRLMNWLHAAFGVGATLGPLIMTVMVAQNLTWRWGYVVIALMQFGLTIAIFVTRRSWNVPVQESVRAASEREPGAVSARATLMLPAVWLGIAIFFVYTGTEVTAGNWNFTLFTEGRGVDVAVAGFWASAYWATFTLGRIVFGFISEGRSVVRMIRGCLALAVVGALLMMWNPTDQVGFLGVAFLGFMLAPIFPLLVSETPLRIGVAYAQHAIGFQVGAANLGLALLPTLAGVLAVRTTLEIIPPFIVVSLLVLIVLHEVLVRRY